MKDEKTPRDHPLWETIVMAVSFASLWAWFLARQAAKASGLKMWPGWPLIQIVAIALLVAILVRRMIRLRRVIEETRKLPNQPPWMQNGHKK